MEVYELIRRDLEEVVEEEVRALVNLVECQKARVSEDSVYFEFKVDFKASRDSQTLPVKIDVQQRLPAPTMIMYIPKYHVTVVEFKVEFMVDKLRTLAMAIVRYYFTPTICFKDSIIIYANIEDIAREIIAGGGGE
jgi:hypothetical protein